MKKSLTLLIIISLVVKSFSSFGQTSIKAQTGFYQNDTFYDWSEEWIKLNDTILALWTCYPDDNAIKFAIFDSSTCSPWTSPGTGISYFDMSGALHCQAYTTYCFDFHINQSDSSQNIIANFINSIPQNDFVIAMSHKNHFCQEWNTNLINAFRSIGSHVSTINRVPDGYPYIMFGFKGLPTGYANYTIGSSSGDLIQLNDSLPCNPNSINELNLDIVSIFPDPAKSNVTIIIPIDSQIDFINLQGQTIKTIVTKINSTCVDLTDLSSGVYIVRVKTDKEIITKKIIKE